MKNNDSENDTIHENSFEANVCDLKELIKMMNGKKHLIKEIIETFLEEIPKELFLINNAVEKIDYAGIKKFSHSLRSTVSIMGIALVEPILKEMEDLAKLTKNIDKIKLLNCELNVICMQAVVEIKKESNNYS